jgi:hypothetical protein
VHTLDGGPPTPHLPAEIILVFTPFAPLFSARVWRHAHVVRLGALLTPGVRTVTAALRAMGLAAERRFTTDQRVLNQARWSARHGSPMRLGGLRPRRVPPSATSVMGADDPVERRTGRRIKAQRCYRDSENLPCLYSLTCLHDRV